MDGSFHFTKIILGPNTYSNSEDIPEELKFVIQETFSENFDSSSIATNDSINQIEVSYDTSEDSDTDSEDHNAMRDSPMDLVSY